MVKQYVMCDFESQAAQAQAKREAVDFTCHQWISDSRLVVGTTQGDVMLFDHGDFKALIGHEPLPVRSVTQISKGARLVVGCESGRITVYDKTDDIDHYKPNRTFVVGNAKANVVHVSSSPQEDVMAILLSDRRLLRLDVNTIDNIKVFTECMNVMYSLVTLICLCTYLVDIMVQSQASMSALASRWRSLGALMALSESGTF